jgi:hypothetical protein
MMIRRLAIVAATTLVLLVPAASAHADPLLCTLLGPNWC